MKTAIAAIALATGLSGTALGQSMPGMDHGPTPAPADPMADLGMPMDHGDMASMSHPMAGAMGPYPMSREASGTSWQPEVTPHDAGHTTVGDWMVMSHAVFNLVADSQGGPRGGDKTFLAGMAMVMAQRPLGQGTLGLRAMVSPDPLMGPAGYPLLLATGETADGKTHLVDRQHPHDLFMELSASYSRPLSEKDSVFVYAGLPGEPAFGPPAFMHRASGMDSPEAPISHHWLDSTHITFGVVTAGWTHDRWRVEGSAFRGREPDEHRFDIETGALDSRSVRVAYNPSLNWSFQASAAHLKSPEALDPDVDEDRVSFSASHTLTIGDHGLWTSTIAYGRKRLDPGPTLDAWLAEAAYRPNGDWTFFGRGESVQENELVASHAVYRVGKLSLGVIRDWRVSEHVKVGLGALISAYRIPDGLQPSYGEPTSGMGFVRLKLS